MAGTNPSISNKKYHFIGAGGIGMSGLAKVLLKNGAVVSGSDMEETAVTENLRSLGADIKIGHTASNIKPDLDAVVISAAIRLSNPELTMALDRGCNIYKYAQMLGMLMDQYQGIAIAGTHGKSTTSGWLASTLQNAGQDPSFIVGADIPQLAGSTGVGSGPNFIAEACEYDRSFLNLHPDIAVILNIEPDHLDYYTGIDDIIDAFTDFANGTKQNAAIIANGSDNNTMEVIKGLTPDKNVITFGIDGDYDYSAQNLELVDGLYHFDVFNKGNLLKRTSISLPGKHNVLNAMAVIAACSCTRLEKNRIFENLNIFTGIDRRIMLKDTIGNITILDDYAHHPTEIRASLSAIRQLYQPKRLWCVFQPHQYSRTRFLLDDFAQSFTLADITIVPHIYFVRDSQQAKNQINAQVLVDRIKKQRSEAIFIDDFGDICQYLKENAKPGDLIVTMGAGDIWKVADEYIHWLREHS
ncbi:MAG: UDP-N-acetylmuramate--L-alanine ligase [Sedimentisphaerales bacterium]|nr:UDP-N-acetylmuramate--L-alanine ligase [Sedimentisphaerales bacterium]